MTKTDLTAERITPKMAAKYLNSNTDNRKLRPGVAEKYASDMRDGRWTNCADPIIFCDDGTIGNGQHRLYAITESGTTQEFIVVRNFPRAAMLNIDTGLPRSLVDNAKLSGSDPGLTKELLAVTRAMAIGGNYIKSISRATSNSQRLLWVSMHREAAEWAVRHGPWGKGIRNSIILGAIGRAWYYEDDKDRLERFSKVMMGGFMDHANETAAVALRNYFLSHAASRTTLTTNRNWDSSFLRCQNAIYYFMRGRSLTIIKQIKDELYPLPQDKR